MSKPEEHKTVQARILKYAEAIGWSFVSREEAEQRRGFGPQITQIFTDSDSGKSNLRLSAKSADQKLSDGKGLSLFFDNLLDAKLRESNLRYAEAEGALLRQFRHIHTDMCGTWANHASRASGTVFLFWTLEATKGIRRDGYPRQKGPFKRRNRGYATNNGSYMSHIGFCDI